MFESCGGCCLLLIVIPLLCCIAFGGVAYYVYTYAPEEPVSETFEPSTQQANELQVMLDTAVSNARSSGWFWIGFSEEQISSWMALEGEDFADQQGHMFPFTNMQVGLDDGDMTFYGELDTGVLTFPLEVVITPAVTYEGDLDLNITSVDVGGLKAPEFVTTIVSDQFEELLIGPLEDLPGNPVFYRETLSVQGGRFEVQGVVN